MNRALTTVRATGEPLGILVEESATNVVIYSVPDPTAYWSENSATITANAGIAPDGTTTASLVTDDGTSSASRVTGEATNIDAATQVVVSGFVKESPNFAANVVALMAVSTNGGHRFGIEFDFVTETVTAYEAGEGTVTDLGYTYVGNGWYRIWASGQFPTYQASTVALTTRWAVAGTPSEEALFWGIQMEQGGVLTSYIPTNGAPVTRASDSLSIPSTKVSEVLGGAMPDAVSLYMRGDMSFIDENETAQIRPYVWSDGAAYTNRIDSYLNTATSSTKLAIRQFASSNLGRVYSNSPISQGLNVPLAMAASHSATTVAGASDGVLCVVDQEPTGLPDLSAQEFTLGSEGIYHIKQFALFSKGIGDEKLVEITS